MCSPSQLDCVEGVRLGRDECLENCQGTLVNVERLSSSVRDDEGYNQFRADYEQYQDPISAYQSAQWIVNCLQKGREDCRMLRINLSFRFQIQE